MEPRSTEFGSFWLSVRSVTALGDPCAGPGRSIRPAKKFALCIYHSGFQRWNRSRGAPTFNSPRNSPRCDHRNRAWTPENPTTSAVDCLLSGTTFARDFGGSKIVSGTQGYTPGLIPSHPDDVSEPDIRSSPTLIY